jgi:hypothetical protein
MTGLFHQICKPYVQASEGRKKLLSLDGSTKNVRKHVLDRTERTVDNCAYQTESDA